ncbi:hypothetical protein Moror_17879 [Moniliophthora roreri MCA 2997]|uniref:BTB domain-containing protein n=1 Tax=Moniliophthora roreri (strain MCA 2997) TaxID=1381753 RepID=V2XDH2_MONRO|nr:hypothetical protein Moror_17879 [Moniliophthora roreri MCA 2997]
MTSAPQRHPQLYIETVVFQVEDTLFRLPRQPFEAYSEVFRTMFTLAPKDKTRDTTDEGATDDNPIRLEGVKCLDFERFARALCPTENPLLQQTSERTRDEWMSILRLSTMWDFQEMRWIAIGKLETFHMTPLEKVLLGREFAVSDWQWDGYVDLITRPNAPTMEEASKIGYADSIQLFQIRESMRSNFKRISGLTKERVRCQFENPLVLPMEMKAPLGYPQTEKGRKSSKVASMFDNEPVSGWPVPGWPGCYFHRD